MARKFLNGVQSYFNDTNYTLLGYDSLDVVGGDLILKRAGTEKLRIGADVATFAGDISIPVAKKLYFGGGNHTYIGEDTDDRLRFFTGGTEFMRFTEDTNNYGYFNVGGNDIDFQFRGLSLIHI